MVAVRVGAHRGCSKWWMFDTESRLGMDIAPECSRPSRSVSAHTRSVYVAKKPPLTRTFIRHSDEAYVEECYLLGCCGGGFISIRDTMVLLVKSVLGREDIDMPGWCRVAWQSWECMNLPGNKFHCTMHNCAYMSMSIMLPRILLLMFEVSVFSLFVATWER